MKTQGSAGPDNLKPTEAVDHSATVGRTSPVSRWEGRTFGALVLAAFLLYGIGSALADQPAGLALVMLNSVAVTIVGLIGFRLLRQRHQRIGISYLVARILEAILLAGGIGLVAFNGSDNADTVGYLLAMVALGLGSVPFCQALGRAMAPVVAGRLGHRRLLGPYGRGPARTRDRSRRGRVLCGAGRPLRARPRPVPPRPRLHRTGTATLRLRQAI
jgi:hypothetical protein